MARKKKKMMATKNKLRREPASLRTLGQNVLEYGAIGVGAGAAGLPVGLSLIDQHARKKGKKLEKHLDRSADLIKLTAEDKRERFEKKLAALKQPKKVGSKEWKKWKAERDAIIDEYEADKKATKKKYKKMSPKGKRGDKFRRKIWSDY